MQDLDKPEEALSLTERMVEVQQRHSQLAKQAEQRTTLLSKVRLQFPVWNLIVICITGCCASGFVFSFNAVVES